MFKSDKFKLFEIERPSVFQNYESLQIALKKMMISTRYMISAAIFFDENIIKCEEKSINNKIKHLFKNVKSSPAMEN